RRGLELNYRLLPVAVEKHEGALPATYSFVQLEPNNVVLTAMKKAEDDDALVLRFYEWAGKEGDVTVQLPARAHSATETDLMEKVLGELPLTDGRVNVHTKPYEIKTVKVSFGREGVNREIAELRSFVIQ